MKKHFILLVVAALAACSDSTKDQPAPSGTDPDPTIVTPPGKGSPGVVGTAGIKDWDDLPAAEKEKIRGWTTIFMHQSVGTDLEDGASANGFRFEYFDMNEKPDKGLSGNVFNASNGMPLEKIEEFKRNALAHKDILKIAIFKFGYADIRDDDREAVQNAYKNMVDDLRAQIPGLRFVHITPPLVYIATKDEGNEAKMKTGQWMKVTFVEKDVVFDLQAVESNDGACKLGNAWRICDEYRSTASCPSKSQGVDAPEGQGHLCEAVAAKVSKAFLMSIYSAGK